MFDSVITTKIIQYINSNYGDELEFLWAKSPDSAVFRHKGGKWYGLMMHINKQKLGLKEDATADTLGLKCDPILLGSLRDGKNYFPSYHMNKEHWITILLDDNIDLNKIFALIDMSYNITV